MPAMRRAAVLALALCLRLSKGEDYAHSVLPGSQPVSTKSLVASAVSWEFENDDLEGWAAAASSEMGAEVTATAGELRVMIQSATPTFDSPILKMSMGDRYVLPCRCIPNNATTTSPFNASFN